MFGEDMIKSVKLIFGPSCTTVGYRLIMFTNTGSVSKTKHLV